MKEAITKILKNLLYAKFFSEGSLMGLNFSR